MILKSYSVQIQQIPVSTERVKRNITAAKVYYSFYPKLYEIQRTDMTMKAFSCTKIVTLQPWQRGVRNFVLYAQEIKPLGHEGLEVYGKLALG